MSPGWRHKWWGIGPAGRVSLATQAGSEVISAPLPFGRPETPHHEDARDHFHNLDHGHAMQDLVREMVHRERAPTLVGSAPNGLGSVPAGIKDLETTLDIDARSADIVQERAPALIVGSVATGPKDLERLANSCRA